MVQMLRNLCRQYTPLTAKEIEFLEKIAEQVPLYAELTGTDVFIDALCNNGVDAVVIAWAFPSSGYRSLYSGSVVGQIAYATREPAVYRVFRTGRTTRNIRGISQERVPIAQTVVPLRMSFGKIVGVLIMEKDISDEIRQEKQVEFLSQTAERLSQSFMSLSMSGWDWENWLGSGIVILNEQGKMIYVNKQAEKFLSAMSGKQPTECDLVTVLACSNLKELVDALEEPLNWDFDMSSFLFQAYPLVGGGVLCGCVVSIKDITELRQKEKELSVKQTIIRKIHHRINNTLQMVISLMQLQMRRTDSEAVKKEFAECVARIMAISLVHEAASGEENGIDIRELAKRILQRARTQYDENVRTAVQGGSVCLSIQQAVSAALILNELIYASFQYGMQQMPQKEISIYMEEAAGEVKLQIVDNQDGLAESVKKNNFGLYIAKLLAIEQLHGQFSFECSCGAGIATVSFLADRKE